MRLVYLFLPFFVSGLEQVALRSKSRFLEPITINSGVDTILIDGEDGDWGMGEVDFIANMLKSFNPDKTNVLGKLYGRYDDGVLCLLVRLADEGIEFGDIGDTNEHWLKKGDNTGPTVPPKGPGIKFGPLGAADKDLKFWEACYDVGDITSITVHATIKDAEEPQTATTREIEVEVSPPDPDDHCECRRFLARNNQLKRRIEQVNQRFTVNWKGNLS